MCYIRYSKIKNVIQGDSLAFDVSFVVTIFFYCFV